MGHRAPLKGGYFPVAPLDQGGDLRSEMLSTIASMGVPAEKHHHEVANSQHELGIKFGTLVKCGDYMQIYKYGVHNIDTARGRTANSLRTDACGVGQECISQVKA